MGLMKWIMKGVDVENETNFQSLKESVPNEDVKPDIDSLKQIATKEKEETQTFNGANSFGNQDTANSNNDYLNYLQKQNSAQLQQSEKQTICVFKIRSEDDIKKMLRQLGKKVVCNMSYDRVSKKQIKDLKLFLSGGLYALGANIIELDNNFYLVVPRGVEIQKNNVIKG